jgi:hypothetical protein
MTSDTLFNIGRSVMTVMVVALILSGCTHTKVLDNWKADQPVTNKPEKVAVIAVLPDGLMREAVEIDIAKVLAGKGTPAIPGSEVPGMGGGIRGEIDPEVATEILKSAGVDGVIVLFYSGGGVSATYERSDYWLEYAGSTAAYSWGRPYFTGVSDVYVVREGPGWSDFQTSAIIESSYYDLETEKPVWRLVTETKDTEYTDTAKDVAGLVASEMRSAGLN